MSIDQTTIQSYLHELFQQTTGDPEQQANMYEIGAAVGLERGDAGSLAEELMVQGKVELKTLSGGIGITGEGLSCIGASAPATATGNRVQISRETVSTPDDCRSIEELSRMVRSCLPGLTLESNQFEEIVVDLKSIDLQLLSPQPKNPVFRQLFASLLSVLEQKADEELTSNLRTVSSE